MQSAKVKSLNLMPCFFCCRLVQKRELSAQRVIGIWMPNKQHNIPFWMISKKTHIDLSYTAKERYPSDS